MCIKRFAFVYNCQLTILIFTVHFVKLTHYHKQTSQFQLLHHIAEQTRIINGYNRHYFLVTLHATFLGHSQHHAQPANPPANHHVLYVPNLAATLVHTRTY